MTFLAPVASPVDEIAAVLPTTRGALGSRIAQGSLASCDDALMERVKAGDVDSFAELYDRYSVRVRRIARAVCRDDGHAQEAVQETFSAIWNSRSTYVCRGSPTAWVLSLARHRAIDVTRRNKRHVVHRAGDVALDGQASPGDIADDIISRAQACVLRGLLTRLPDAQREAITLCFYGQLTHTEIAAHLGLPLGTVKGRVRLGLEKLRGDIERMND